MYNSSRSVLFSASDSSNNAVTSLLIWTFSSYLSKVNQRMALKVQIFSSIKVWCFPELFCSLYCMLFYDPIQKISWHCSNLWRRSHKWISRLLPWKAIYISFRDCNLMATITGWEQHDISRKQSKSDGLYCANGTTTGRCALCKMLQLLMGQLLCAFWLPNIQKRSSKHPQTPLKENSL